MLYAVFMRKGNTYDAAPFEHNATAQDVAGTLHAMFGKKVRFFGVQASSREDAIEQAQRREAEGDLSFPFRLRAPASP